MKTIMLFLIGILSGNLLFAQGSIFVTSGAIEYTRSVNMYAIARESMPPEGNAFRTTYEQAFDNYKKNQPQFGLVKSTLVFANNKTLFTPATTDNVVAFMASNAAVKQYNTVYTDLSQGKRVVQKDIIDEHYLLTDSLSKITWKIIGGNEEVAGYSCREAHGLIQDSIYIVAFYTDKIRTNGGPESFSGLPGMILKLVLPHEHITWTATKVIQGFPATPQPPKKGKPVTSEELNNIIMKTWSGRNNSTNVKFYLL